MSRRLGHRATALVTGATSGIGLEFARILSDAGCDVLIVGRNPEKLQRAATELNLPSDHVIPMDLARREAADELFSYCSEHGFAVDILINNAGMFFWEAMTPERFPEAEKMIALHEITPMRLCVLFGEEMKKRGCGYIVNVASAAAQLPFPGLSCYSGTKAFLKNFSKSIYHEYRPHGVRVCALCPAAVSTGLYGLKQNLLDFGTRTWFIQRASATARGALKAVKHGRKVCYPAVMCYYLPLLLKITPGPLIRRIWRKAKGNS